MGGGLREDANRLFSIQSADLQRRRDVELRNETLSSEGSTGVDYPDGVGRRYIRGSGEVLARTRQEIVMRAVASE